ncbi:hypothetical protein SAMN05444338_11855 [Flavobacterium degerlachei]|jgi:hypothetical protein|uniref:Uncharacterized protein n=1 Tax=Flavobacterium degerlachei TaxID=229203 RepID=A0A1H3FPA0_9FLAO|nr:hypothetical protein SAMN05444338_11855 [Flavobacterium degerlachei]
MNKYRVSTLYISIKLTFSHTIHQVLKRDNHCAKRKLLTNILVKALQISPLKKSEKTLFMLQEIEMKMIPKCFSH